MVFWAEIIMHISFQCIYISFHRISKITLVITEPFRVLAEHSTLIMGIDYYKIMSRVKRNQERIVHTGTGNSGSLGIKK